MKKLVVFVFLFNAAWVGLVAFIVGSGITSAVKAGTDSCGTTYGIESVVKGDWFCPDED